MATPNRLLITLGDGLFLPLSQTYRKGPAQGGVLCSFVERSPTMCGIVGYLRKPACKDERPVGTVVLEMLRALSIRGPDSAGVALYGPPEPEELRVRVKLGDGDPDPELEKVVTAGIRRLTPVDAAARHGECLRLAVRSLEPAQLEREILHSAPAAEVFSIGTRLELMKQVGHPDELERQFHVAEMEGTHALGHTRLSTESRVDISHSQPFWTHGVADLAVVHNGHITNYHKLRRRLEQRGYRFYTENDSEVIGPYLAEQMTEGRTLQEAMERSTRDLDGTFCYLVASAEGLGLVKDFFCSKPLVLVETGEYVAIATEELAIRRALPDAPPPEEPGANAVRFWVT
jgi:methylamine---glutamate N-methyltransferase subunit A